MESVLIALALLVGGLLTVQAAANVQLNTVIRNPSAAAAIQLGLAAASLGVLAAAVGQLGALRDVGAVEPWHLIGGVGSALYITAGIVLFPRLGALTSVGLFIAGQMLGSLVLDAYGLLGLTRQPISAAGAAGALAVVASMGVIVTTGRRTTTTGWRSHSTDARHRTMISGTRSDGSAGERLRARPQLRRSGLRYGPLVGLGVLAGAGLPVQAAINARLRADLDAPLAAAAGSFIVATAAMLVLLVIATAGGRGPAPRLRRLSRVPWWGWLGGFVGASYVTVTLLAVPEIGAAPAIALTIAGQQLISAIADHRGLLRLPRRPVTPARLIGVAVLLTGAVIGQLS